MEAHAFNAIGLAVTVSEVAMQASKEEKLPTVLLKRKYCKRQ